MKVDLLKECGYNEAVLGFSLSYNTSLERTEQILPKYAWGISGESKFLESIFIWLDVTAPRYWWQEADTYRIGSTKQSESTMHTICKKPLTSEDFYGTIRPEILYYLNSLIEKYKVADGDTKKELFLEIKNALPEGFMQRRIWCINYKTLKNIIEQRYKHRLPQWKVFCDIVLSKIEHPEFVKKELV